MDQAILVGIDRYPSAADRLEGCGNDVDDVHDYLVTKRGFDPNDILVLKDEAATARDILGFLKSKVSRLDPGDRMIFHYAGHGAQVSGEEVICPFDYPDGVIKGSQLRGIFDLVQVPDVELVWVADTCYAGGEFRGARARALGGPRARSLPPRGATHASVRSIAEAVRGVPHVAFLAACGDKELAHETVAGGVPRGLFTSDLFRRLREGLDGDSKTRAIEVVKGDIGAQQTPQIHGDPVIGARPFLAPPLEGGQ